MATSGFTKKQLRELQKLEKLQKKNLEQKSDMIKWIVIGAVSVMFLALFIGAVAIGKNRSKDKTSTNDNTSVQFSDNGHVRMAKGEITDPASASAKPGEKVVTMVEYADIQCPACKQYQPIIKNLLSLYPDQLKLIFKQFPLSSVHKNGIAAAIASEAAGRQGKFFQFIDIAYDKQAEWGESDNPQPKFEEFAKEIGLNLEQFKKDQKDPAIAKLIDEERNEGIKNGVNSTPTYFINGRKINNPQDIKGFQKEIDAELKATSGNNQPQSLPGKQLPLE